MRCRDWIPGGTSNRDGRCAMWMMFLIEGHRCLSLLNRIQFT